MANAPRKIGSIEELREQVPAILKRVNADQRLLKAALANPILALEELGYEVPSSLHRQLDRRIRFSDAERKHLDALERAIHKAAGFEFDPDDPNELEQALFTRLRLPDLPPEPVRVPLPLTTARQEKPYPNEGGARPPQAAALPLHRLAVRYHAFAAGPRRDVLSALEGKHPVVGPLLEYRTIVARQAPFAPRELYARIRDGSEGGPKVTLRARLHSEER